MSQHGDDAINVRIVARINQQFDELGHVFSKERSGRSRSVRMEENQNAVSEQLRNNGRTPMSVRRLSSVIGLSRSSV